MTLDPIAQAARDQLLQRITNLADASTGNMTGTTGLVLNLAKAYALVVDPARAHSDDAAIE